MALFHELQSPYPADYPAKAGLKPDSLWLAERCAMTRTDSFYIRQQAGNWVLTTGRQAALHNMRQNWLGGPHHVTDDDLKRFMGSNPPIVDGGMKVPTSTAPYIEFMGSLLVNTWMDTIMKPDADVVRDPLAREPLTLIMRMIRESLCGRQGVKTLDEMIAAANGDDPAELEFCFLMAWLAAPLQQVGRNLQTNAWLLGELGGSGKGTLVALMSQIYGSDNVVVMNCAEIEKGGWTDALVGKLMVVVNEIEPTSRGFDWGAFLKTNSTDDVLPIRKRNTNAHPVLNFGNWLMASNNEGPACLDSHDRRNALIATTTRPEVAQLAQNVRWWMQKNPNQVSRVLSGFVALLHNQRIHEHLLERAPDTLLKTEVQDATSRDGEHVYWLNNDDDYPRDRWMRSSKYADFFCAFHRKSATGVDPRGFGGALSKLARKGLIEARAPQNSKTQSKEYLIPSSRYPSSRSDPGGSNVLSLAAAVGR